MASDLDLLLIATLEDRAGGDVDPAALTRAAVARGRRIRCRRSLAGGAALVLVAVLGTALLARPAWHRHAKPTPVTPGVALVGRAPLLPPATGNPGAVARPDLVGTDARVLHFSVDGFAGTAREVTWSSQPDYEEARVLGDGFEATVELSRTEKFAGTALPGIRLTAPVAVRVAGRAGALQSASTGPVGGPPLWSIRWQPTTGLWTQVTVQTPHRGDAERLAGLVRFDVAQRCVLPFVLTSMRSGAAVSACTVTLSLEPGLRLFQGKVTVESNGQALDVQVSPATAVEPFTEGLRAGPYRVNADDYTYTAVVPPYWVNVDMLDFPASPHTRAEILNLLAGLRTRGEPTDPMSW